MTNPHALHVLTEAAVCLQSVALANDPRVVTGVRLPCVWAVELLVSVGAVPVRAMNTTAIDAPARIVEALELLGSLPLEVFGDHAVLEAAASARAALNAAA
jgi:hypothetical protein